MKTLSPQNKSFLFDLVLVALIVLVVGALMAAGVLEEFDFKQYDSLVRLKRGVPDPLDSVLFMTRGTPVPRSSVVFVCIDQASLAAYDKQGQGWPWPRAFHARMVDYLASCGAKAIVFDMILSERDVDRLNAEPGGGDGTFGESITASNRTLLVIEAKEGAGSNAPVTDARAVLGPGWRIDDLSLPSRPSAVYPIQELARGAAGFGLANPVLDRDGVIRRYPLAIKVGNAPVPSLALAVFRKVNGDDAAKAWIARALAKKRFIDREGNFILNWYGPGDVNGVFKYYSYRAVMEAAAREETTGRPDPVSAFFRDRIVIVGSNAPGLLDNKSTPVSRNGAGHGEAGAYPGMEVHATAIENLLNDDCIFTIPRLVVFAVMALVAALLFTVVKTTRNLRHFMVVFLGFLLIEFAASYRLVLNDIWFPSVGIYLTTILVFVGLETTGYFAETREKRLLRKYFERYVNDSVLEEILANPKAVDLKGRTIHATVMASDIQDFTNISEKMDAYDLVARLNGYLSEVSEVLISHGAFINKYIGDAILALYGAFGEEPGHQERACRAVLAASAIIDRLADEARAAGLTPFITRFGINTGEMTMGNIGSARKIEYTVIGDAVNSAFRLEGINKYYGTRILVSEYTRDGAGDGFEFRLVDILQFKGKDQPVRIYELLGGKGAVHPDVLRRCDAYEAAFGLYTGRRFSEARAEFARLKGEGDTPSATLEAHCAAMMEEPPAEDWNGVWKMYSK